MARRRAASAASLATEAAAKPARAAARRSRAAGRAATTDAAAAAARVAAAAADAAMSLAPMPPPPAAMMDEAAADSRAPGLDMPAEPAATAPVEPFVGAARIGAGARACSLATYAPACGCNSSLLPSPPWRSRARSDTLDASAAAPPNPLGTVLRPPSPGPPPPAEVALEAECGRAEPPRRCAMRGEEATDDDVGAAALLDSARAGSDSCDVGWCALASPPARGVEGAKPPAPVPLARRDLGDATSRCRHGEAPRASPRIGDPIDPLPAAASARRSAPELSRSKPLPLLPLATMPMPVCVVPMPP